MPDCPIIDSGAGIRASEVAEFLDDVNTLVVPVLPSVVDLESTAPTGNGTGPADREA